MGQPAVKTVCGAVRHTYTETHAGNTGRALHNSVAGECSGAHRCKSAAYSRPGVLCRVRAGFQGHACANAERAAGSAHVAANAVYRRCPAAVEVPMPRRARFLQRQRWRCGTNTPRRLRMPMPARAGANHDQLRHRRQVERGSVVISELARVAESMQDTKAGCAHQATSAMWHRRPGTHLLFSAAAGSCGCARSAGRGCPAKLAHWLDGA